MKKTKACRLGIVIRFRFRKYYFCITFRHLKSSSHPPKTTGPPMGYVSSTLGSDILTEGEDEEGDSEGYELSRQLCGIDYSPGRSLETVEGAITGEQNY